MTYTKTLCDFLQREYASKELNIIGHPPTLNDLLRALRTGSVDAKIRWSAIGLKEIYLLKEEYNDWITIPLDLQPTQYDEELSEKLCKLLGLSV